MTIQNFDDVSYRLIYNRDDASNLYISMRLPCYETIKAHGGEAALEKHFKEHIVDVIPMMDVTLCIDLDNVATTYTQEQKETLVEKLSSIKPLIISGVFDSFIAEQRAGNKPPPFKFNMRDDTCILLVANKDQVNVVFHLTFKDASERVLARNIMLEFQDAKVPQAPSCQFYPDLPSIVADNFDAQDLPNVDDEQNLGFLTFTLLEPHMDGRCAEKSISTLITFRSYLQYHIKCSKTYFHQRMRAKVKDLLLVLNRAQQDSGEKEEKKTRSTRGASRFRP